MLRTNFYGFLKHLFILLYIKIGITRHAAYIPLWLAEVSFYI